MEKALKPDTSGLDKVVKKQDAVTQSTEKSRKAIKSLQESQTKLNSLYRSKSIDEEQYKKLKFRIEDTTAEIKRNEQELTRSQRAYEANAKKVEEYNTELARLDTQLESIAQQKMDNLADFYPDREELHQAVEGILETDEAYQKVAKQAEKTQEKVDLYTRRMNEAGDASADFSGKLDSSTESADKLSKGIEVTNDKAKLLNVALGAAAAAGALAVDAIGDAVGKFIEFSESFSRVTIRIDETVMSLEEARSGIIEVSKATGQAGGDLSLAMDKVLGANIKTADSLEVLQVAGMNARAGFTDASKSADILTAAINAYGLQASDAITVSDKLIVAQQNGRFVVDDLGSGFGELVNLASTANISLDEVSAALAAMTSAGIEPQKAISNLRQVISNIINPSDSAAEAADNLRIKFDAQALKAKGLAGILETVERKTHNNVGAAADLFGSMEALTAVMTITGSGSEVFEQTLIDLQNTTGATAEAFEKISSDPAIKFQDALNRLEGNMVQVGEAFAPVLNLLSAGIELLAGIDPKVLAVVMTLAAAAGMLGTVALAIRALGGLFPTFNMQMQQTAFTVIAVVAALVALAAIIAIIAGKSNELQRMPQDIGSAVGAATGGVQSNTKLPQYARGTRNAARGLALVGEEGPELVYFGGGEGVFTASQTARMLSSPTSNTYNTGGDKHTYIDQRHIEISASNLKVFQDMIKVVDYAKSARMRARQAGGDVPRGYMGF